MYPATGLNILLYLLLTMMLRSFREHEEDKREVVGIQKRTRTASLGLAWRDGGVAYLF
jgi:hypothetical protein